MEALDSKLNDQGDTAGQTAVSDRSVLRDERNQLVNLCRADVL